MKQVVQNLKNGKIEIIDVSVPALPEKFVLVENLFSLISVGTEKRTVNFGKSSLLKKAIQRPDLVKQVLKSLSKDGISTTAQRVSSRLESLTALGYSTSGLVISSFDNNSEFKKGDRVACAGQNYASHSEYVSVPQNLTVKIPDNVSMEDASFTTLGAIAMQGIRQSNVRLGERVCVIGLGLLGQISCQLLKANGCQVLGIDVSDKMIEMANENNFASAYSRNNQNLQSICDNFSKGKGFDKVIITAKSNTNDPIILATEILRKKGEIILVGEVPMDIPREPNFYPKELELKISCSYGPGRYDSIYEEDGNDYPFEYVRWTEKRNMESFLDLLSTGKINLKPLITHIFDIEDAKKAYDLVLGNTNEDFIGVLINYGNEKKSNNIIEHKKITHKEVNIGFVGAGNYAQSFLIPQAKKLGSLDTVVTQNGISASSVGTKFQFSSSSTDPQNVFENKDINTVFIATPHDTHSKYAIEALKNNKNVFIEKPLAINQNELNEIKKVYNKSEGKLMVGFNRRFSKIAVKAKECFDGSYPLVMQFRVNAGIIDKNHWIQREIGGGRIIGEICHFIDLMQFFTNSNPKKVFAEHISTTNSKIKADDNISITIKFSDGSVGSIVYVSEGGEKMDKEKLEVFGGGSSIVIHDFKNLEIFQNNKRKNYKYSGKGQKECVKEFISSILSEKQSPISFNSAYFTTLTTFKIIDCLKTGLPQIVDQ